MDKKWEATDWTAIIKGAVIGAGGSMLATLAMTALAAWLISRGSIDALSIDTVTAAVLILSAVCGSFLATAVTGHHRLPVCMATGVVYILLLLSCAIMLFDGVNGTFGVTVLAVLGGCGAVALLGLKEMGKSGTRRHPKSRNWKVVQNSQRGN